MKKDKKERQPSRDEINFDLIHFLARRLPWVVVIGMLLATTTFVIIAYFNP